MTTVSIIIGSTREARFGDKPGRWIFDHLGRRAGVTAKLLDLRDYPLPFFDQAVPPAMPGRPPYANEVVQRWTAAIGASDAFIVVAAEYNFGPPAVLKNAIDWVYPEWNRKPVGFVSYGAAGGTRSVQQLRELAVELQMAPIRSAVHLPRETLMAHFTGGDIPSALAKSDADADRLLDDLLWWANALKVARAGGT
ncbi:NAD(P)H-dependent oxidoreductase [Nannocystis pusilla]|uniref:NAD(P)H-dependent oxidoreductase n=1 Tax=Nannocystis pusilla TaxID=889268 RepID=A0A9X3J196_9BACT|nr:NAD(P)H-dependent oxidoreductase [Nannocystis pusilla]MCY1010454.1 NAD(P)H-dependent oxidoreductase [Nannocystis pusilla]